MFKPDVFLNNMFNENKNKMIVEKLRPLIPLRPALTTRCFCFTINCDKVESESILINRVFYHLCDLRKTTFISDFLNLVKNVRSLTHYKIANLIKF